MARSTPQSSQRYPLTQVLGTEANVRLLRALALHGGQLSAPSLVVRTGLAKGSVRTGLAALLGLGAVAVTGSSHAQLYALRLGHPLAAPIEALFAAERARFDAVLAAVRQAGNGCAPSPSAIYLCGSVARGQDGPESDLDILVVMDNGSYLPAATRAMRDALQQPGECIGFVPLVIGLSRDDVARAVRGEPSSWREALQKVIVVAGKDPASLVRPKPSRRAAAARPAKPRAARRTAASRTAA